VVLLANDLRSGLSIFAFQNFPIYAFIALGTVTVLFALSIRVPRTAWLVAVVIVVNALIWSAVWTPRIKSQWLRVSVATSQVIDSVTPQIKTADEVVASHGISGQLSQRQNYFTMETSSIPVRSRHIWFIDTPQQGIERQSVTESLAQLTELVGPLHGHLVASGGGAWVVEVTPPRGTRTITFPANCTTVPAWALPSDAGTANTTGPVALWGMVANGHAGYLVKQGYQRLPKGSYLAAVTVDTSGPLTLQVLDADRSLLLAQTQILPSNGPAVTALPFNAPAQMHRNGLQGVGPWTINALPLPPYDQIEIRVVTPGHTQAVVRNTEIIPAAKAGRSLASSFAGTC
jgi:hypothetical protein